MFLLQTTWFGSIDGPTYSGAAIDQKVRTPHPPEAIAHLEDMDERLERLEKDIAKALNEGDLAKVRRLSRQWSHIWLLNRVRRYA